VELESSSILRTERSIAEWCMDRSSKKHSKREDKQRDVRKTFKILREVWLNIGVEKVDIYEGITIKALLDSGVTRMFMDRKMVAKYGFRL